MTAGLLTSMGKCDQTGTRLVGHYEFYTVLQKAVFENKSPCWATFNGNAEANTRYDIDCWHNCIGTMEAARLILINSLLAGSCIFMLASYHSAAYVPERAG